MAHRCISPVDVLVLGSGPVGLTLANEVARGGASVRIVDKAPAIREISKALIWHVRTQEALDKVGIMERGLAEARPLKEVVIRAYGKRIGSWHFPGVDSPFPHALIIGQNRTQHFLQDLLNARGAQVEWRSEAVAIDARDPEIVSVTVRSNAPDGTAAEERVAARYVVGCEGSDSLVRKTLGLTFEGEKYTGEQFIQADCKIAWNLPSGRSYLFLTDEGVVMVIEMPGDRVRIVLSLPDAASSSPVEKPNLGAIEDMHAEPTLTEIHEHLVRLSGLEATLSAPVWLARYRTSHRYASSFRQGRLFIAGDAGHVHVPIGGHGMNTGIQDAFNLGWKLAGVATGVYAPNLLETYDAERLPVAEALIRSTDRSYRSTLDPSALQQHIVRLLGPFVASTGVAQRRATNVLEELTIAYPHSPLNYDGGGSSGPKAGDRAPVDAFVVRSADRATVQLAEIVRSEDWSLLIFGGTDLPSRKEPPYASQAIADRFGARVAQHVVTTNPRTEVYGAPSLLIDAELHLHASYGVTRPAFYLLRPDGYVGMRGPAFDEGAVLAYLSGIFASRLAAMP